MSLASISKPDRVDLTHEARVMGLNLKKAVQNVICPCRNGDGPGLLP